MHLYLDVNPQNGAIKLNFPHLQVWELAESCALDVADRVGEKSPPLAELARALGLSYDRAFQVVAEALVRARESARGMTGGEGARPGEIDHGEDPK